MDQKLPAYSSQFAPETLPALLPTMPLGGITADWAWGGATGAGIRVAVIDSGIDASHEAIAAVETILGEFRGGKGPGVKGGRQ